MYAAFDRLSRRLSAATALVGGAVMVGLTLMMVVSIVGRALSGLGLGPVRGDYELAELGIGFAVFCFLPWAQYAGAHARVDMLAPLFGRGGNRAIDLASEGMMLAAGLVMFWRLWAGTADKRAYGETTFILQWPLWPAYAIDLAALGVFVLVAAFCVWRAAIGGEVRR